MQLMTPYHRWSQLSHFVCILACSCMFGCVLMGTCPACSWAFVCTRFRWQVAAAFSAPLFLLRTVSFSVWFKTRLWLNYNNCCLQTVITDNFWGSWSRSTRVWASEWWRRWKREVTLVEVLRSLLERQCWALVLGHVGFHSYRFASFVGSTDASFPSTKSC